MLTEKQLDQFLDEFWEDSQSAQTEAEQEISEENLEEYALPADGMIIRQMERKGKVSRRTWFALVLMLLVVPLLLYLSVRYFHGRKYLICSLIVIIAAMIPFFMMFEGRKPKAREIMVISVLAAIGVAGRAAFFMVPSFKPVAAIVILTGISFGGEAGFLVGCLIMMLSNMFMGQVADVCVWDDRLSGRNPVSERNSESPQSRSLYIRIFECIPYLWRNHESGGPLYECVRFYMGRTACNLYFRYSGRSCSCQFYIYFSVDWSKAIVGKAAADKNKI